MSNGTATPLQTATSADTDFQALEFFVLSRILNRQTVTVVQVLTVTPPTDGLVGTVDVLPLVGQIDGGGNLTPHETVYGRPYSRVQGGTNAIIMDPAEGDIGVMVFASRDISSVIASQKTAPPASGRLFSYADGLYLFSIARGPPAQNITFAAGIAINSPVVSTSGNFAAGTGASGSFSTPTGQTVTVQDGIIVNIF